MARAIWTGAISFGLVTVPVKLYTATDSHRVSFHQFQEGTGERIRYQRVAEGSGEEVEYSDIVKGAEVEQGRHVIVTPEELEAIEPGRSRTIDLEELVDLDEIDPITWNRTYYLGTLRPIGEALAIETMFFADEIRPIEGIDGVPVEASIDDRQLGIAEQLIESMTTAWEPARYRDTYHERVLELIERKAQGVDVVVDREEPETAEVADLMDALQASVEAAQQRRGGGADAMSTDGRDGDLSSLSKQELYERASEADVSGRSKMNKDELVEALDDRRAS